jgi:hypothetical protein
MRTFVALALVAGLGLSGCRKKSALEFYELESRATILVSRDGEAGLMSEEMGELLAKLKAIPGDTVEGPKASELWAKLEADRQALLQQRAEAAAIAQVRPADVPYEPPAPPRPAASIEAKPDAGPTRPWGNMSLTEFQARFGGCMQAIGDKEVPGRGVLQGWEVLATPTCMVQYGIPSDDVHHFFLFRDGKLALERTEQRLTTIVDAGRASITPAAPAPAAPYVMGMPVPGAESRDAQ